MNAHFMGFSNFGGGYYIYLSREVKNPRTEFKGLKIRSNQLYDAFVKALGAVPVTTSTDEIYSAIQTHIVDGAGFVPDNFFPSKIYEVAKYWIVLPFYGTVLSELINLDRWNAMPKNLQDALTSVTDEIDSKEIAAFINMQGDYIKKAPDLGMKLVTFSDEDAAWYIKLAYDSKWNEAKGQLSQQDYDSLYKLLNKPK